MNETPVTEDGRRRRQLTTHIVNPANDKLVITVLDEPGAGGANHTYKIEGFVGQTIGPNGPDAGELDIHFQNGPIAEVGVNGVTHEALLAILIDRLQAFQSGTFKCDENAAALHGLQFAQRALLSRTKRRMDEGVEGTHEPDAAAQEPATDQPE